MADKYIVATITTSFYVIFVRMYVAQDLTKRRYYFIGNIRMCLASHWPIIFSIIVSVLILTISQRKNVKINEQKYISSYQYDDTFIIFQTLSDWTCQVNSIWAIFIARTNNISYRKMVVLGWAYGYIL
jgi:hypothetical protein